MASQNNLHVPDELLAELRRKAMAQGKTLEQLAEEALRNGLEEQSWEDLTAYGYDRGQCVGFTEDQAADVVEEWRNGQRR